MQYGIFLFFIMSILFGFLIDLVLKEWKAGFIEKIFIRLGTGILLMSVVGVIFNHLRVPLHWVSFLILSFIIGFLGIRKALPSLKKDYFSIKKNITEFKLSRNSIYLILGLVLLAISFNMYMTGSFVFPWLENGDAYGYAMQSKYIAEHMTYEADEMFGFYSAPYTQGYQIVMGVMHQTNDSLYWSMKFYHGIVISLSIIFMYFMLLKVSKKHDVAFWGTFSLLAVPAWITHFIFSLSYNMALMPVFFYALFSIDDDKDWSIISGLLLGSILINHFYTAVIIFTTITIVLFTRLVFLQRIKFHIKSVTIGLLTWLVFLVPTLSKHWNSFGDGQAEVGGLRYMLPIINIFLERRLLLLLLPIVFGLIFYLYKKPFLAKKTRLLLKSTFRKQLFYIISLALALVFLILPDRILYARGTGTIEYGLEHFFVATDVNLINNPFGIGLFLMVVFLIGCLIILRDFFINFKESEYKNKLLAFNLALFGFIGVMGASLSIGFMPFRMWTFFAFFLSIVVGYTISEFFSILRKRKLQLASVILLIVLVGGVYITSFRQTYSINTDFWPEHWIMDGSGQAQSLFIWMRDGGLPKDSMVMPLCNYPRVIFGYDMYMEPWKTRELYYRDYISEEPSYFYRESVNMDADEIHEFLIKYGYEYVILGVDCVNVMGHSQEDVIGTIERLHDSESFTLVNSVETAFIFKVE